MTDTPTPAEALRAGIDLINGDLTGVEWKHACRDFIKQATAALAAAPQPAPAPADDRAEMIEVIEQAAETCPTEVGFSEAIADAMLAQGYRRGGAEAGLREGLMDVLSRHQVTHCHAAARAALARPSAPETLAWAVIGPEGEIEPDCVHPNLDHVLSDLRHGERVVRVAIRVVQDGGD